MRIKDNYDINTINIKFKTQRHNLVGVFSHQRLRSSTPTIFYLFSHFIARPNLLFIT